MNANATAAMATASTSTVGLGITTLAGVFNSVDSLEDGVTMADGSLNISPVTLSSDWSRVVRLLLLASLAVIGSVGNVFMISAIMVEDHLKKKGNAFLVNVALADLLISGMVIPASAVLILAGHEDSPRGICNFEWTLEALCFLVTVFTFTLVASENFLRLCWPVDRYNALTTSQVTAAFIVVWLIALTLVGVQSYLQLGPNLCDIDRKKPFMMRINTSGIVTVSVIIVAPMLFAVLVYARLILSVRSAMRGSYKPSVAFNWDYELTKANMYSFFFFILFWLPLGITFCVSVVKPVSPKIVFYLAWFALSKSCFNNLLYCVADRHFRSAYIKLFHYCCCKTTVSFSRRQRGGGGDPTGGRSGSGDVKLRVHIIHSYASPSGNRPTTTRTSNGREFSEL
ncbi:melatonin receptor type 1A-like [Phymastichus coffea]|uniref:melatonin receptor type 1A-like n=1 Tax=Phymastichus coffea TaxID=108790 RepID=UPI00273B53DE|nr:melatonin receptor type 1A-like [Phymastichus coffea]XP_058809064.1 melatonin receptor type 1A-like [Phymastichus coffea]XP_058809065.1 melatonin receptor type 1A-like [Phymastichus coffea]XP_058809066.1 melatonin receptor type 1A-like [Phymastichus coffea]XP_058809067.1 melatonin receptor type 1A-like [Phymastichus coffea]